MKSYKRIIAFLIVILLILNRPKISNAAGSFSVSNSNNSLIVGATSTLTIKTSNAAGQFIITSSNSGVVSVGETSKFIDGSDSITLTAKSAGTATITVTAKDVSDTDLKDVTGSKTVTINVSNPASNTNTNPNSENTNTNTTTSKSNDATLKSVSIKTSDGTQNTTISGTSVKAKKSVTYNCSTATVTATTNNSKAKIISGTGTIELKTIGTNSSSIVVQAEDGTKKTYTLKIIRLAEEETVPNIIEKSTETDETEEIQLYLTSIEIIDVQLSPEFNSKVYNYIANVKNMKSLEINAVPNITDAKISIEGADDLVEGDNNVKIILEYEDKRVEYTIGVYNTIEENIVASIEENENYDDQQSFMQLITEFIKNNIIMLLIIILISILSIIAIWCAILAYKYSKKLNELVDINQKGNTETIYIDENTNQDEIKSESLKKGKHF